MTATNERRAGEARRDWEERIGRRTGLGERGTSSLPPPAGLTARAGEGVVVLDWTPVPGAAGYLIHAAPSERGPFEPLDHGGGDVLAIPAPPYADTTDGAGGERWYAVASIPSVEDGPGELSKSVRAARSATTPGPGSGQRTHGRVSVELSAASSAVSGPLPRPWRPIVGAEHLSQLEYGPGPAGRPIGEEFAAALSIARRELGVRAVRAHAILLDELGVYREVDGEPRYDFGGIDRIYERLLGIGLRPVVELSFMPRDLAADPSRTVFEYGAIISPPRDWDRWGELVERLGRHLVERFGRDEVLGWRFEVWNEANLDVFWTGSQADYFRLYDVTAAALRRADPELRVGGPSTAAAGWVGDLLEHVGRSGAPLDFLSTHEYGNPPLDIRAIAARFGRPDVEILWTEWGVHPRHFNPIHDLVFGAPFALTGMRAVAGRAESLSYWVISDHFEELGRPPRLFHGGFGLLTVGNLRKPRFWSLALLERLGRDELPVALDGDGAGALVRAWASRNPDGRIGVLVWNGTLDQSKASGADVLGRRVALRIRDLTADDHTLRHWRIDETHSNIGRHWQALGEPDWPDQAGWLRLQAADRLDELEPARIVRPDGGRLEIEFELPMPGVSFVELTPA